MITTMWLRHGVTAEKTWNQFDPSGVAHDHPQGGGTGDGGAAAYAASASVASAGPCADLVCRTGLCEEALSPAPQPLPDAPILGAPPAGEGCPACEL